LSAKIKTIISNLLTNALNGDRPFYHHQQKAIATYKKIKNSDQLSHI